MLQAASALSHLEALQLVHGDIKLPNIMLVNHGGEPLKIKLIDFGLTCKVAATRPGQVFQTLPYRSVVETCLTFGTIASVCSKTSQSRSETCTDVRESWTSTASFFVLTGVQRCFWVCH